MKWSRSRSDALTADLNSISLSEIKFHVNVFIGRKKQEISVHFMDNDGYGIKGLYYLVFYTKKSDLSCIGNIKGYYMIGGKKIKVYLLSLIISKLSPYIKSGSEDMRKLTSAGNSDK